MRHLLVFALFFFACCSNNLFAQSGKLKAYIDHKTYFSPETGTFAEIHFQFVGYTLKYEAVETGLQTNIAMGTAILNLKGDTVARDLYVLQSPVMRDSIIEDFFDIQRYSLPAGQYVAHIALQDLVANGEPMTGQIEIAVEEIKTEVATSDILIAEVATPSDQTTVFSKSGFEIIPRISNFYGQNLNNIPYYVEVYNTHLLSDTVFAIRQRIISSIDKSEIVGFSKFTKLKSEPVVPFIRKIDISKLPSGSYTLEIEVIDRNNEVLSLPSVYYFERVNELMMTENLDEIILDPTFQTSVSDDSLNFYLSSLIPIARPAETKMIIETLKTKNLENYRKHIQQFWVQTSGANAAVAWAEYKKQVLFAQKLYSNNFQDGFETDRGRVYLQYGPPNSIVERETSPTEYPYEIWVYYKIKMYSNKRFIFYNPDLVNNAYRLLHSDMIGELQNYRWQQALSKRNSSNGNIDDPNDGNVNHYGGESNDYFRRY